MHAPPRVRARHRPAGAGQPGRLPRRRAEGRHPRHRRDPSPLPWQLRNAAGTVVASGTTDAARASTPTSGQNVHDDRLRLVPTRGHRLHADRRRRDQPPVRHLRDRVYEQLRADSLSFFYHAAQRHRDPRQSSARLRPRRRPPRRRAEPGRHRRAVPARRRATTRLDVRGGWYDAGDHGKYVVNGGISVAQLLNTYERTKTPPAPTAARSATARCAIPERGNGVPDVLDEARWELEFLLRMQVPAGKPHAGMVHHKVHDEHVDRPAARPADRTRSRASCTRRRTAATLNLAAVAAQGARVFEPYDPAFAARCLAAARTAWAAAQGQPGTARRRPPTAPAAARTATTTSTDEFYWAAAELYITHRRAGLPRRGHSPRRCTPADAFAPGGLRLALRRGARPARPGDRPQRLPRPGAGRGSSVVDGAPTATCRRIRRPGVRRRRYAGRRALRLGLQRPGRSTTWSCSPPRTTSPATPSTATASLTGLDYLLGRNALNQSYVTGYGERPSHNQHHRSGPTSSTRRCPTRRAGSLAGGPNSGAAGPGRARQQLRGLRAAVLLHRRHRVVLDQRGHHQLELGAGLGRVVRRRPG